MCSDSYTIGVAYPSNRSALIMVKRKLRIGLCGGGIGGLAASIAIARAGCDVTVLEAAAELGEVRIYDPYQRFQQWHLTSTLDRRRHPSHTQRLPPADQMGRSRPHRRRPRSMQGNQHA